MIAMGNKYSADNAASRRKLEALVAGLTDRDLAQPVQHGWNVGGILAHLAFYDYRVIALLERWKAGAIGPSPHDVDAVNDAQKPLFNAVAPAELRRMVVEAACAVDSAIDTLDPGFLTRIEVDGTVVRLSRVMHRQHHLEQLHRALGAERSR